MTPSTLTEISQIISAAADALQAGTSSADRLSTPARRSAAGKSTATKRKPTKKKKTPTCTAKDLRTKKSKRRNCVVKPKATPVTKAPTKSPGPGVGTPTPGSTAPQPTVPSTPPGAPASPTGPVAAPPATSPGDDAFPTPHPTAPVDGLRTFDGAFGVPQATRLLFRAGFGPKRGQAEEFAALGLTAAVDRLLSPGAARMEGPAPSGTFLIGGQFAPRDRTGHMHLQMLDLQLRSTDSLTERMTLILHDWFAVNELAVNGGFFPDHIQLLRAGWRGSFRDLLVAVTKDKSMLQFLNGIDNRKNAPNENYARELMELFALGADRGAYTEQDVRELARALTGFLHDWRDDQIKYDPAEHDETSKTLFAGTGHERSGNLSWEDAVHAVVDHPLHSSFVVRKLWANFIPTEPTERTQRELEELYRSSGERLEPLVRAILLHPDLHAGAAMVKPPAVLVAGMLRGLGRGVDNDGWPSRTEAAGQRLGQPPNVAGWNDRAWLNTSTHSARWELVAFALRPTIIKSSSYSGKSESADQAVTKALASLGDPVVSPQLLTALKQVAATPWSAVSGPLHEFLALRQNVLRQMICAAPDFQVS